MSMDSAQRTEHFAAWHDTDLVRALKLERADYQQDYLDDMAVELDHRGVDLGAFVDQVEVSYNAGETEQCSIAAALDRLREDFPFWHALSFTRHFGATLVVQHELHSWLVSVYEEETYSRSFFVAEHAALRELLHRFLLLDSWEDEPTTRYDLDNWKPLLSARSGRYVQKVAEKLADAGQPCTVQTPVFTRDPGGQLALLVPDLAPAEQILYALQDHLLDLYAQAVQAQTDNALDREIAVYAELADYGLNNPAVHYNLGAALVETGRHAEAATAFIEAASLSLAELDSEVHFQVRKGSGGLGGAFGALSMLASAFKSDDEVSTNQQRELPDHVEDIELQLIRLLNPLPDSLPVHHSLAAIAAIRHDVPLALERYRKILTLAPDDESAKLYIAEQEA